MASSPSLWWNEFAILRNQSGFRERLARHETDIRVLVTVASTEQEPPTRAPSGRQPGTSNANPSNPHRAKFGVVYTASKTSLNAITLAFAIELASTNIKVNAACPGFTATDLNNFAGTQTVEQAAREPVRLALLEANGPAGTFSSASGPIPW